jgi:hypothetical protein
MEKIPEGENIYRRMLVGAIHLCRQILPGGLLFLLGNEAQMEGVDWTGLRLTGLDQRIPESSFQPSQSLLLLAVRISASAFSMVEALMGVTVGWKFHAWSAERNTAGRRTVICS